MLHAEQVSRGLTPYKEKVANTGAGAASMEAMIRSPSAPRARLQSRVTGRILQLCAVRPSLEKGELSRFELRKPFETDVDFMLTGRKVRIIRKANLTA
jgi:hypothetical protein